MAIALVRAETLYAWKGPSLFITTPRGECGEEHPLSGFYYREARVLRTFGLEINGDRLWLAEAAATSPECLEFTYVHPEITQPGGGGTGQAGAEEGVDARERLCLLRFQRHRRGQAGTRTTDVGSIPFTAAHVSSIR